MGLLVANSSTSTVTLVSLAEQIPFPDMRICFEGFRNLNYFSFETDTMTPQQFIEYRYIRQLNATGLAILDESNHYMMNGSLSCWLISGPEDEFYITQSVANNGFAPIYEDEPGLMTVFQSSTPNNVSMPAGAIDIYPSSMAYLTMQDQQIYTFMTVLGSAAGLLGLLITLDRLLFGARSISPWGLVHRWSFGKLKVSLRNHLHEAFGFLRRPILFVHSINNHLFDKPTTLDLHGLSNVNERKTIPGDYDDSDNNKHINLIHKTMAMKENSNVMASSVSTLNANDESSSQQLYYEQRMHILENRLIKQEKLLLEQQQQILEQQRRWQLMELMNKAYYTDPEIFYNLDKSYDHHPSPLPSLPQQEKDRSFKGKFWRHRKNTNDYDNNPITSITTDSTKVDHYNASRKTASISSEDDLLI
ncbi:hypothetical protein BDA99DRAFT_606082 [Phascolomyces articulosus]|uniref:Uncharacterized protein n=1 Tax=Phascolomyces articulosus TaxID=60185 RepID=A0AAD5JXJ3_9FUNG|nr:hypothetical protein BDA99DRAFT_606082 [Phascolomyces articulosus]